LWRNGEGGKGEEIDEGNRGKGYGVSDLFIVDFEIGDVDCAGICWGGEILDLSEEIGCDAGD